MRSRTSISNSACVHALSMRAIQCGPMSPKPWRHLVGTRFATNGSGRGGLCPEHAILAHPPPGVAVRRPPRKGGCSMVRGGAPPWRCARISRVAPQGRMRGCKGGARPVSGEPGTWDTGARLGLGCAVGVRVWYSAGEGSKGSGGAGTGNLLVKHDWNFV